MDWQDIIQFIRPETLIVSAALWCLGLFLKKAPWLKQDWQIPFILLGLGIILMPLYVTIVIGTTDTLAAAIISGILQGLFAAALAVFGNELKKQITVKRLEDNLKE